MTSITKTPNRLSEQAFRRFEPLIVRIVEEWPAVSAFDPRNYSLSYETLTCRLRDAITAYIRYGYASPNLERAKNILPQIVISQKDGLILAGSKESLKTHTAPLPVVLQTTQQAYQESFRVSDPTHRVLEAFCLLLSERLLDKPLTITNPNQQHIKEMQEQYDIAVSPLSDGSLLIM